MSIRIDIDADGKIEIARFFNGRRMETSTHDRLEDAYRGVKFLMKLDLVQAHEDMFVSQLTKDSDEEYRKLKERLENGEV